MDDKDKTIELTKLAHVLIEHRDQKLSIALDSLVKHIKKELLPLLADQLKGKHTALEALIPSDAWNYFTSYPEVINELGRSFPELMKDKKLRKIFKQAIEQEFRNPYIQPQIKHRQPELKGLLKPLPNLSQKQTYGLNLSIYHNMLSTLSPWFSQSRVIKFIITPFAGYSSSAHNTIKREAYNGLEYLNKNTVDMINFAVSNFIYLISPDPKCPDCKQQQKMFRELLKHFTISYSELQAFGFLVNYVLRYPELTNGLEQHLNRYNNYLKNMPEFKTPDFKKLDIFKQVLIENRKTEDEIEQLINDSPYYQVNINIDEFIKESLKDLDIPYTAYESMINNISIPITKILSLVNSLTNISALIKPYKGRKIVLNLLIFIMS